MRRNIAWLLSGVAVLHAAPALAADALKYGPPPTWVRPLSVSDVKPSDAPYVVVFNDEQIALDPGKVTSFDHTAIKIQNAQGLSAGNISFVWQPGTDTVTINKLVIHRGDKIVDVLAGGQTFTVLRRETNLDAAMLDGTLTGNIQPEGLEVGDIIELAMTVERSDPVLAGHVESMFAAWNGTKLARAHALLTWPTNLKVDLRESQGLPVVARAIRDGRVYAEISATALEPIVAPKDAPDRFSIGRLGEATDFTSWNDVSRLMAPLYRDAAVIPATGPLHDEVERIRAATSDPKSRAQQALTLVQDRIRYVALEMGQGGYVPSSAETTWSRRFGDCKAKTALLLAVLHSVGIDANPVLVQSKFGDMIADRLPMVALFDHVLVRANIAGKDYWLDGTRTGDTDLDSIQTPDFGWGLPLVQLAQLVRIIPQPLTVPATEVHLNVDASKGVLAPAPATGEQLFRGDAAVAIQSRISLLSDAQREEFLRTFWSKSFDFITFKSGAAAFDKAKRELRLTMAGEAKLDWSGGNFHVPQSSVGYHPDFDRQPGPFHDAPFAIGYPGYTKSVIRLQTPPAFYGGRRLGSADIHETVAGIRYDRTAALDGNTLIVETSARSLVPEISYKEAKAAEARLLALDDEDVSLPLPAQYRTTDADLAAKDGGTPTSASEFVDRGSMRLDHGKLPDAILDFNKAIETDPKNAMAYADRAMAYVWKRDYDSAEKDLQVVQTLDPTNIVALRARALMAEQKGECQTAISNYGKVLEREPNNTFALGHRAICEQSLGKSAEALSDTNLALQSNPAWVDLRVVRANIFFIQGDSAAVAQEANLLVQQNPNSDYAFVAAGKIYSKIGKQADALKEFDRALAIKPAAYIYVNRAQTRPFTDRSGRLADLDTALKLDPGNPDALAEKAEQIAVAGDYKGALQLYSQISKTDPYASYFDLRRAVLLYKAGQVADATKLFAEQRTKAKSAQDFNRLCWAKATAGVLLEEAMEDCHEALKLMPDTGGYIDSLAFVELRMGKVDDAITDYGRAIALKSGSASYMGRAIAYSRKGDKARSDADLREALRLDENAQTRFEEFGVTLDQASGSITPKSAKH